MATGLPPEGQMKGRRSPTFKGMTDAFGAVRAAELKPVRLSKTGISMADAENRIRMPRQKIQGEHF